MEKYVNFRLQKSNIIKVMNQYNHDKRIHSPKYINVSKSSENKTLLVSDSFKALQDKGLKTKALFSTYNEEQKIRIKEKTGRKAQASAEFFNIAIMTFSNSMIDDYKNSPQLFDKCSLDFLNSLENQYGFNIMMVENHQDESVPHLHILFDNIGKNGKGIRRTINPKKLSDIQTLMGKCFAPMGYKRGESKELTNRKHLTVAELHNTNKIYERLRAENIKLEKEKTVKQNLINLLAEDSPKMQYIIQWIKGEVSFSNLSEQEQKNVIKYINTPTQGN